MIRNGPQELRSHVDDTCVVQGAYGAIEAGGTKWVCAIGNGPDDLRAETRFPTTTPAETLARAIAFFQEFQRSGSLKASRRRSIRPGGSRAGLPQLRLDHLNAQARMGECGCCRHASAGTRCVRRL